MANVPFNVSELSVQTLYPVLVFGASLSLAASVWLLISPTSFGKHRGTLGLWFSLQRALRPLDEPRTVERFLYRHHKVLGVFLIAGSTFALYSQAFHFDYSRLHALLDQGARSGMLAALIDGATRFLFFGNLFAFAIGVVVLLRPSLLKDAEMQANRWVSIRQMMRFLNKPRHLSGEDRLERHGRVIGLFVALASLYVLMAIGIWA